MKCGTCKKIIRTKISYFKCEELCQKCFYRKKNSIGVARMDALYKWVNNS